jgi:serine/threonine protein kinase
MVMELLTGEDMSSLRDRVRVHSSSGLIPVEIASFLTRQMLRSLQAMHERGYVHRDVKASNFVRRSPTSTEFCMIDFGLAKSVSNFSPLP